MLNNSDADTVRQWLVAELAQLAKAGKGPADLATFCGVSPQAVNGWKKTGRITKSNLERAAKFLGTSPSFSAPGHKVEQSYGTAWPFLLFSATEIQRLTRVHRDRLDRLIRDRLDEWDEDHRIAKIREHGLHAEPQSVAATLSRGTPSDRAELARRIGNTSAADQVESTNDAATGKSGRRHRAISQEPTKQ